MTSISDIKKLWGRAAGRCSYPGCSVLCIDRMENPTVIGEMAHLIAKSPRGPRADHSAGDDTYENLILLCPTHHTIIDKAPERFPEHVLVDMKSIHEESVLRALSAPHFMTKTEICRYISQLLIENHEVWRTYGPESKEASNNPLSNLADIWSLRKLDTIVPNNSRITDAIHRNKELFDSESYRSACTFIEHAKGFEISCYNTTEGIPRFPINFEKMIVSCVNA